MRDSSTKLKVTNQIFRTRHGRRNCKNFATRIRWISHTYPRSRACEVYDALHPLIAKQQVNLFDGKLLEQFNLYAWCMLQSKEANSQNSHLSYCDDAIYILCPWAMQCIRYFDQNRTDSTSPICTHMYTVSCFIFFSSQFDVRVELHRCTITMLHWYTVRRAIW